MDSDVDEEHTVGTDGGDARWEEDRVYGVGWRSGEG